MITNVNEFQYVVEGCRRASYENPFLWKPVAAFKYKADAENFVLMQRQVIIEAASVDLVEVRLRQ